MYLSHIFTRHFEGNKNDSPGSEQICAPRRLLKQSLITIFNPRVSVECAPEWITLALSLFSIPATLSFSLKQFLPLYCFHTPGLLSV